MTAQFTADTAGFADMINKRAIVFGIGREEAFKTEGRLLAKELIDRTPPFSGKSIVKMLGAQGKRLSIANVEVEGLSAQRVGVRRVEKDIRRVIHGLKGAVRRAERNRKRGDFKPSVIVSQTNPRSNYNSRAEWSAAEKTRKAELRAEKRRWKERSKYGDRAEREGGVLERVQGKDAIRIYADKRGTVYGVDTEQFMPRASRGDISKFHNSTRLKSGKVSKAGSGEKITGRWKWLNKLVVKASALNRYLAEKKRMVGQAKGGWAAAYARLGGRISIGGWIGRHAPKVGRIRTNFTADQIVIEMINRSRWSRGGDDERIIPKAIAGRAESLKAAIWRQMNDAWKKGGSVPK